jgi:hypothetical protein
VEGVVAVEVVEVVLVGRDRPPEALQPKAGQRPHPSEQGR